MKEYETYIFHYCGKLNQNYVLKDLQGNILYEAICEKIRLFKDTPYLFCDHLNNYNTRKMISHTITHSVNFNGFSDTIKSSFKVDNEEIWQLLCDMGYDFHFQLNGLHVHFDMLKDNEAIGYIETGGTELIDAKYANSPLGKIPSGNIYKISCEKENIPGFFLMCFALAKTELSLELLK